MTVSQKSLLQPDLKHLRASNPSEADLGDQAALIRPRVTPLRDRNDRQKSPVVAFS
jgi:hypothetical protein